MRKGQVKVRGGQRGMRPLDLKDLVPHTEESGVTHIGDGPCMHHRAWKLHGSDRCVIMLEDPLPRQNLHIQSVRVVDRHQELSQTHRKALAPISLDRS
jgi:hypothetical protein